MLRHLGYMAATQSIDAHALRTCGPGDATPGRIRSLVQANLRDLGRILRFNAEHGIALYRIPSQVIPFASHPGNPVSWWDEFAVELEQIGQYIRRHGLRVEMHPGHHCLLNSPSPETVALSILELGWHVRFLDALHLDHSHKLVLRVGGQFGDKGRSIDRFVSVINGLPDDWRGRLVVENDDTRYNVRDVLSASERIGVPVVFDWLADRVNPAGSPDLPGPIGRCWETWRPADGAPVVHLSSLEVGGRGHHVLQADWVDPRDLEDLIARSPDHVGFDCLLEATQGDRALFDLRERMAIRELGDLPSRVVLAPAPIV